MAKKSKRTKRSKSKMKRGFETKNQSDRLKKKKFKRYKKKTKRKIRKRLTGGSSFEGDPPSEENQGITVSSGPTVVSPNILDIVYNGLGLPSVIYDLFVILYVFQNDYNYDDDVDSVKEMLEYHPESVAAVQRPQAELELLQKLSKKTGRPMPVDVAIISNHDTYDLEHKCQLINERFQEGAEEPGPAPAPRPPCDPCKLQTKIELFINEYLSEHEIKKNESKLTYFERLLDLLEKDISSTEDPRVNRSLSQLSQVREGGFASDPTRRYEVLKKAIKIVKNMEIIALEYEHTIRQKKMILYRGLKNKDDGLLENRSLSFGLSLFGGLFADLAACTAAYLAGRAGGGNAILSVYIFNPQAQKELFYIPPLIPIASLFAHGELFHGRSKLSIEFGARGFSDTGAGVGPQGFATMQRIYFPKHNFGDPRHRYLQTVVTNLTNEEIKSRFTEIRGENYVNDYDAIELEGGRTGYKIVYDF